MDFELNYNTMVWLWLWLFSISTRIDAQICLLLATFAVMRARNASIHGSLSRLVLKQQGTVKLWKSKGNHILRLR